MGFIGITFLINHQDKNPNDHITNVDSLTTGSNIKNLEKIDKTNYQFVQDDIKNSEVIDKLTSDVDLIVNFAAETHVDRSISNSKQFLENIVEFDEITNRIAEKFWPGRLTIVLPLKDDKLKKLSRGTDTLAVRVPNNKCVLSILKECKLLVGTSANISTKESFVEPNECANSVTGYDVFVNGGKIKSLGESTIIEIVNKEIKIVRQGVISEEELFSLV